MIETTTLDGIATVRFDGANVELVGRTRGTKGASHTAGSGGTGVGRQSRTRRSALAAWHVERPRPPAFLEPRDRAQR